MKPARIIVIAVAAVSAVGLALVVRAMGSDSGAAAPTAAAAPVEAPTARVLVARRDLRVGERLQDSDFEWKPWPIHAVNAAYVTDGSVPIPAAEGEDEATADGRLDQARRGDGAAARVVRAAADAAGLTPRQQFIGAVVREPILAGEPIVARKLVRAGQSGYLAVVLAPGMRAMAVQVSAETGAGGFILPGDRVDVIMSRRAEADVDGTSGYVTATVLRNIKVLAMGEVTEAGAEDQRVSATTATLEVGPTEAELLAFAEAQGDLFLTLRSYADADEPSGGAAPMRRATAEGVRVFRNGEATVVPVRP